MKVTDKPQLRIGDVMLLLLIGFVVAGVTVWISYMKPGNQLYITFEGKTVAYNLYENQEISLVREGSDVVENTVVIEDGTVYMKQATCPDRICVKHSPISKNGETIVCLPNKVFVEVENDVDNEIDN